MFKTKKNCTSALKTLIFTVISTFICSTLAAIAVVITKVFYTVDFENIFFVTSHLAKHPIQSSDEFSEDEEILSCEQGFSGCLSFFNANIFIFSSPLINDFFFYRQKKNFQLINYSRSTGIVLLILMTS